jgi:hypothetical protein
MATEAGRGEHHFYTIIPEGGNDQEKLTAGSHYIGVDALSWFVNKTSYWFLDRMASGTLDIKMSGTTEDYPVALGRFHRPEKARIAHVFEKPVLSDRNYRGGPISLSASLYGVRKEPVVNAVLKSAAIASLGIVAGMVETATVNGPVGILAAAGKDITTNVQKMLADSSLKSETLFDFSLMDCFIRPESMTGPEIFVLFHRGSGLDESRLSVNYGVDVDKNPGLSAKRQSEILMPYYNDSPLEDGAWLLIRLRRSDEYSGARSWLANVGKLREEITKLVNDVKSGLKTKEDGLAQFKPSATGNETILDEFFRLRSIICSDGVLTEREAGAQVGLLYVSLIAGRDAIKKLNPKIMTETINDVYEHLSRGKPIDGEIGQAFTEQVALMASSRSSTIARTARPDQIVKLSGNELFSTMQHLSKTLKR